MQKVYKQYEVRASVFQLKEGDRVGPETEIGIDHETGIPVTAGSSGTVANVGFNSMNHSLMVTVEEDGD